MEYHECADYLRGLQTHRPKLGVGTTRRMLAHLGDPQEGFDCVQIAGSNGKGSTARMLERVLRAAGLHVGLFTSPRLHDIREQIRVDGRKVPRSGLAAAVEAVRPCVERLAAEDDEPTHFEVLTAVALAHFGAADVDVAVLEVGIGGRYDATSAVDPVASAVTSVSLEHTDLLGDTVEEIARDKAQVAPEGRPLVTGADGAALAAIREETDVLTVGPAGAGADVTAVEEGLGADGRSAVSLTGPDWEVGTALPLLGEHQALNAGVAAALSRQVADAEAAAIDEGLRGATWPGRFEVIAQEPMVVLDGSHNPGAAAAQRRLIDRYDYEDLHVVFGAMADKDHERMVEALPPVASAVLTRPNNDRAEDPAALAEVFEGHAGSVERIDSVAEATERALAAADAGDFVLVTGSLYTVAEARDRWTRVVVPKSRGGDIDEGAFTGAWFPDASTADLDHRVVSMYLRPDQAERVAERIAAAGGECRRSAAGAPGEFLVTVVSGTVPQLQAFADGVATDGLGLGYVAEQVRQVLAGPPDGDVLGAEGTAVMGILNVTPDSFHDGGEYTTTEAAVERAEAMVAAGADIVDVGGESTRPGAEPVPAAEERDRVVPVVEALGRTDLDVPISVDTRKATVADAALEAGADIVNDVSGLGDPDMRFVVAEHDASLVLMHSVSTPVDPDRETTYDDVVADVIAELNEQVLLAERAGIDRDRIIVDPGCGFGKSGPESFELVDRLAEFDAFGCPVMVGHSRKSMFAPVAGEDRLPPTLAVTAMAAERGADVVRVHDVAENAAVLRTVDATTRR